MEKTRDNNVPASIVADWRDVLEIQVNTLIRSLHLDNTKNQMQHLEHMKKSLDCIETLIIDYRRKDKQ